MRWDEMMRRTVGVKKCRRPKRLLVDIGSITRRSWNMITEKMKTEKEEGREETENPPLSLLTILVSRPTGVTLFPLYFFFVPTIRKIPPRPFGALYAVVVADAVEVLVAVAVAVAVNR